MTTSPVNRGGDGVPGRMILVGWRSMMTLFHGDTK